MAAEGLVLRGTMRAYTDIVTASLNPKKTYGFPLRRLTSHSHFVQEVVLPFDCQFALFGSWDGELRLRDLALAVRSPVNPKAFDIGYPSNLPALPHSTPDYPFVMR